LYSYTAHLRLNEGLNLSVAAHSRRSELGTDFFLEGGVVEE
jgi:hypothetical protein